MKYELPSCGDEEQETGEETPLDRNVRYLKRLEEERMKYWAEHPDQEPSAWKAIKDNLPKVPRQST